MLSIQSEVGKLIQGVLELLDEEKRLPILASKEDCDAFRLWASQAAKPKPVEEKPVAKPVLKEEPPAPKPVYAPPPSVDIQPPAAPPAPIKMPAPKIELEAPLQPSFAPLPILEDSFADLRKIWAKINPSAPLFDTLPDDETAKKIASRWKTKNAAAEISILSYHEPPAQKALLEEIAKAVNILLGPAQIVAAEPIEKEKQWEAFLAVPHLKLTIACDYTLWQLGGLMQHYKETPSQGTRHLGSIPVFLLPDLSLYLKDPLLKRSLWKALCQTLCS